MRIFAGVPREGASNESGVIDDGIFSVFGSTTLAVNNDDGSN